ncbi:hypothetical protein EON64_00865, partial [archaeon]
MPCILAIETLMTQTNAVLLELSVQVKAVNDAPQVSAPSYIITKEDTAYLLDRVISVSDADYIYAPSLSNLLTVSMICQHCAINLAEDTAVIFLIEERREKVYKGTLYGINKALDIVSYVPDADFFGYDTISLTVSDNGYMGAHPDSLSTQHRDSIPLAASHNITVYVRPVAGKWEVVGSGPWQAVAHTPLSLQVVSIAGDEQGPSSRLALRLLCEQCLWASTHTSSRQLQDAAVLGVSTKSLLLVGSASTINTILAEYITYTASSFLDSTDNVTAAMWAVGAEDLLDSQLERTPAAFTSWAVFITGRAQPASLHVTPVLELAEDDFECLTQAAVTMDPAIAPYLCRLQLYYDETHLRLTYADGLDWNSDLQLRCSDVLATLKSLCVAGQKDVNSANYQGPLQIIVSLSLPAALSSVEEQLVVAPVLVRVRPVDDIVTIMYAGTPVTSKVFLSASEGDEVSFKDLSIVDVDSWEGGIVDVYELILQCSSTSNGGIAQDCTHLLRFQPSHTVAVASMRRNGEVTQRGNLGAINAVLASMTLILPEHFSGDVAIVIVVASVHNNASRHSARVLLSVQAVNNPISLVFPGLVGQTVTTVLIHERAVVQPFNLTVADHDDPDSVLSLRIAVEDGFVFANALFLERTRNLLVNSTIASLNALLPSLSFQAPLVNNDRSMLKVITANVSVSDLTSSARVSVRFHVLPVNDPPVLDLPKSFTIAEKALLLLSVIGVDDIDSSSLTLTVSVADDVSNDVQYQFVKREYNIPSISDNRPVVVTGSVAHIKSVLQQSTFAATAKSAGDHTLTLVVQAVDGKHLVQANTSVTVTHVEPLGQVIFPATSPHFPEDNYVAFTVSDLYQVYNYSEVYELNFTISVSSGCLQTNRLVPSPFFRSAFGASCASISVATTQGHVNEVLQAMFLQLPKHFHGVVFVSFDMLLPQARIFERPVVIDSVNNAPVVVMHNLSSCLQGSAFCEFSVTISDVDAQDALCPSALGRWEVGGVKLYGRYLSLNVSSYVAGMSFSLADESVCFLYSSSLSSTSLLCHAAKVNGKPFVLKATSPRMLYGRQDIAVTYSDNGLCSDSLVSSAETVYTMNYSFSIDQGNVAPLLAAVQTHFTCSEDSASCYIPSLSVDDPDLLTFNGDIVVALNCTYGILILDQPIAAVDSSAVVVEGNATAILILRAESVDLLHKYAAQLRFRSKEHFNGAWPAANLTGQRRTKSVSAADLASISVVASDGHSVSNRVVLFPSVSWVSDAPFVMAPVAVNVTDSRQRVFQSADDVVLDDPDSRYPSFGQPDVYRLRVTASDSGKISLNREVISSGIVHSMDSLSSQSSLELNGSLNDLRTAVGYLEYDGSRTTLELSYIWIELCDNGQFGFNESSLCATASVAVHLQPTLSFGYTVAVNATQTLHLFYPDDVVRVPEGTFELTKSASSSLDEKSLLQLLVSAKQGSVAAISSSPYSSDLSRTFILTIPGVYEDVGKSSDAITVDADGTPLFGALGGGKQVVQKLVVSVPWQYAVQRIDIFSTDMRSVPFPSTIECLVTLTLYNVTYSLPWTWYSDTGVVDDLQNAAVSLKETLVAMSHMSRDVVVEVEYPNSTVSEVLVGSIWVKFVGNAGPVPPLNVSLLSSSFSAITSVVNSGSMSAEVQEVVISNYSSSESGEYQLLFTKVPYMQSLGSTGLSKTVDIISAKIAVNATDDTIQAVLNNLFEYLRHVDVFFTTVTTASGVTERIIRMSFPALGTNLQPIEVLTASNNKQQLSQRCSNCRAIASSSLAINVRTVCDGTDKLDGFFTLSLSGLSGTHVDKKKVDVPVVTSSTTLLTMKVQELLNYEVNPYGSQSEKGKSAPLVQTVLVECTHEQTCTWLLYITYFTVSAPVLSVNVSGLLGSGVDVRVHVVSSGRAVVSGDFDLVLYTTAASSYTTTSRTPVDVSASQLRDSLLRSTSQFASEQYIVDVSVEKRKMEADSVFIISLSWVCNPSSAYLTSDAIELAELQLPALSMGSSAVVGSSGSLRVSEMNSQVFTSYSKQLFSVQYPSVPEVSEMQTIVCTSRFLTARRGFSLSFRNVSTAMLFTDSYLLPEALPPCSSVVTGLPCRGDGLTVFERLSALYTIPIGSIRIVSNSSTGMICPEIGSYDNTYVTNITFVDTRGSNDSLMGGSTAGNVPMLVIRGSSLNSSALHVREAVIGSTRERGEVQRLQLSYSGSLAGFFTLALGSKTYVVPVNASEKVITAAIAVLFNLSHETLRVTREYQAGVEYDSSIIYTILFPQILGPVQLLHVLDQCTFVTPANESASMFGSDFASSVSCLTIASKHLFEIRRVVPGYASLRGSVGFKYFNPDTLQERTAIVDVTRVLVSDDLRSMMADLTGVENVTVSRLCSPDQPNTAMFLLEFSLGVGIINIDLSNVEVSFPVCVYEVLNQGDGSLMIQTSENSCNFPFVFDGRPYSACAQSSDSPNARGTCVKYADNGMGSSGLCYPCIRRESDLSLYRFHLDLVPFRSDTARFVGNLEQLQNILQSLVYHFDVEDLRSDQLHSFAFDHKVSDMLLVNVLPAFGEHKTASTKTRYPGGEVDITVAVSTYSLPTISAELAPVAYVLEDEFVRLPALRLDNELYVGDLQRTVYYSLKVSTERGRLFSLSSVSSQTQLLSFRDGRELSIMGNMFDVNRILRQLAYQPDPDFNSALSANATSALAVQRLELMLFVKNSSAQPAYEAQLAFSKASFKLGYADTFSKPITLHSSDEEIAAALNSLYGEELGASSIRVVVSRTYLERYLSISIDVFISMNANFDSSPLGLPHSRLMPYGNQLQELLVEASCDGTTSICAHNVHIVKNASIEMDSLTVSLTEYPKSNVLASLSVPIYVLPTFDLPIAQFTQDDSVSCSTGGSCTLSLAEDHSYVFSSVAYVSVDGEQLDAGENFTVTFSTPYGTLNLSPANVLSDLLVSRICNGRTFAYSSSSFLSLCLAKASAGDNKMVLSGSLDAINRAIQHISYVPLDNIYGGTYTHLAICNGSKCRKQQLLVNIANVVDKPTVSAPDRIMVSTTSGTPVSLFVRIDDPDLDFEVGRANSSSISSDDSNVAMVALEATSGFLSVPRLVEMGVSEYQVASYRNYDSVVLNGTIAMINTILAQLKFSQTGLTEGSVHILYKSASGSLSKTVAVSLAPESTLRATLEVNYELIELLEDSTLALAEVVDVNFNHHAVDTSVSFSMLLSADVGSFQYSSSLLDASRVQFVSMGNVLRFVANSSRTVQAVLKGIFYVPLSDYTGSTQIALALMTHKADSATFTDTKMITVLVTPEDDLPTISINASYKSDLHHSSSSYVISKIPLSRIFVVEDTDDIFPLHISANSSAGSFLFDYAQLARDTASPQVFQARLRDTATADGSQVDFYAYREDINRALEHLVFHPPAVYKGDVVLS